MTYFDEQAKNWDAEPMRAERARAVAEALRVALPLQPGLTALEYGCGTGLLSFALQADFAHITLADASEGMLEVLTTKIAAAGLSNLTPLKLDLATDPAPAACFDVTYSLMVLHHIPNTANLLRQFATLLKPGGWLCIADLDAEDGSFHAPGTTDVHQGFERAALQKQVEAAGFGEIRFSTAYIIHKKVGPEEKSFPVFLLTARKAA